MLSWIAGLRIRRWWLITGILYVLGMMTYEPAVVLPLLLLCLIPLTQRSEVLTRGKFLSILILFAVGSAFWFLRTYLLGNLTTDVDPLYGDLWTALSRNGVAAVQCMRAAWGTVGLIILLLSTLLCLRTRQTRYTAIALVIMASVFYLPYVMVVGVAPRFLFMAQAPLCFLIALPASLVFGKKRIAFIAVAVVVSLFFCRASYRRSSSVTIASNIGRNILDTMAAIYNERQSNMVLDGVPDYAHGAPIMSFYFETAARTRLRSTVPVVARSSSVLQSPSLLHAALTQSTRYFRYDQQNETLGELDRSEWVSLHSAQIRAAGECPACARQNAVGERRRKI